MANYEETLVIYFFTCKAARRDLQKAKAAVMGFQNSQVDLNNKCVVNNWSLSFQLLQHPCNHVTMFWALGNQLTRWLQCPRVTCSSFVTFSANQAKSEDKQAGKITSCLGKSQQPLQASKNSVLMLHGLPPHFHTPCATLQCPFAQPLCTLPLPNSSYFSSCWPACKSRQLPNCFSMTLVMGSWQEVARNASLNNPQTLLNDGKEDCWIAICNSLHDHFVQ